MNTGDVANCGGTKQNGWIDWTPIGNSTYKYTGTFDGQNHTISGLYFNDTNTGYVGLFGYNKGTIKNVGVIDSYFSGKFAVGGVCGKSEWGTIENCYNTGAVSGTGDYVGGVCGSNEYATIKNCYNTGKVSGTGNYTGGVCGYKVGNIENCYNTGSVSGTSWVGGVCGTSFTSGNITNCYNTGAVSGTSYVGGVCGTNGALCYVTNCYYLAGTATDAIGANSGEVEKVESKDVFNSGEVAYLLQSGQTEVNGKIPEVWGQTINTDTYPVLGGKKVLANRDNTKFANDVMIYGQNAALDGTIDFNIYVAADDNYEWSAKIDDEPVDKPEKTDGLYKFTCKVAAKDMAKDIEFYINDDVKATVSVKKYLDNLNTSGNTPLTELVTAMETYGTAADKFFNGGNVDPVDSVTAENLSGYTFTKNDAPEGISYYGSSLILKSETTVRHYFQLEEGKNIENFKFYVDDADEPVTPVEKQGYYYIDITNISADKLGTAHTVKINETTVISNYSALSYAETVLSSETANDNLKNLVKTLYLYNQKAYSYSTTGGGN